MKLEGDFSEVKAGDGPYSMEQFKKSLHELMDKMNTDRADNGNPISKTYAGVTLIGSDFYVRFGATDWEMKYGFEQHAANAEDSYIQAKAIQRLIILLMDKIKEKYT